MPIACKDLPVQPSDDSDRVLEAYTEELRAVTSEEQLRGFVARWKNVHLLPVHRLVPMSEEEKQLVDGSFDAATALRCVLLDAKPDSYCEHAKKLEKGAKGHSCHGMYIAAPVPLLFVSLIAHHYQVPFDIALIQTTGGYTQFEGSQK